MCHLMRFLLYFSSLILPFSLSRTKWSFYRVLTDITLASELSDVTYKKTLMCRHANQKGNVKSAYISSDPTIFTFKLSLLFFWQLPHWGSDSFSIPRLIPYENFTSDWFESIKKMNVTALQLVTSLIWFDKWCWIWRGH